MALFNKNFIANKPVLSNFDDFEMNIKARKLNQGFKLKPFPILESKYKAKVIKPFQEKHLDIDDHLHVKKFKTIQDKDGNYFLDEYGILNKKDIKIQELPKVPAPDIRLKNLRKELGISVVNNADAFADLYEQYLSKIDGAMDIEKVEKVDKVEKPKREEVKIKIEPVLSHIEDKMDVKDLHTQVEKMFEEKRPKTIRIKNQKQKEDSNKIALEILDDILKDVDEIQRKEEEKREKRKKKETDKEDRKQKKALIKESREILEGILEKKLEEKETPIKEKRKTIPQIEEEIETHFEESLENKKGYVEKEAYVKDLESLTTEINKLLELKPSNVSQKTSLNEETEKYFKETILPILEKVDIPEELLFKRFFNKKSSTNFTYGNVQALKRSIMKFQKEYRLEKPHVIERDIKEEK